VRAPLKRYRLLLSSIEQVSLIDAWESFDQIGGLQLLREDLGNAYALPTECYLGPHGVSALPTAEKPPE